MSEASEPQVVVSPDEEPARYFLLDRDSSVMIRCPDCDELLWLDEGLDDVETLGDVIDAASGHQCGEGSDA